jgi:hypothetical protein
MICGRLRLQLGHDLLLPEPATSTLPNCPRGSERPRLTRVCDELLALKPGIPTTPFRASADIFLYDVTRHTQATQLSEER